MEFDDWFQGSFPRVLGSKTKQSDTESDRFSRRNRKEWKKQGGKLGGQERISKGELPQEESPICDDRWFDDKGKSKESYL